VGLSCAPDGRLFVWEKLGLVYTVEDGVKQTTPVLDISPEVGAWGDHGLLGFALDPHFGSNGYIYLLYVVDHHHLKYFGTPQYSPFLSEDYTDTIGRITRWTVDLAHEPLVALPGSRRVLLGTDASDGFPICMFTHGIGSLVFGRDGSLLASCGTPEGPSASGTCFAEGILRNHITPALKSKALPAIKRADITALFDGLPLEQESLRRNVFTSRCCRRPRSRSSMRWPCRRMANRSPSLASTKTQSLTCGSAASPNGKRARCRTAMPLRFRSGRLTANRSRSLPRGASNGSSSLAGRRACSRRSLLREAAPGTTTASSSSPRIRVTDCTGFLRRAVPRPA